VIQNKNQQNRTAMSLNNTTLLNSRSLRSGSIWFRTTNHTTLARLRDAVFKGVRKTADRDYWVRHVRLSVRMKKNSPPTR